MATTLYRMGTGNGGGDEPTGKLVVTAEVGSTVHVLNTDTSIEMTKVAVGTSVTFIVDAGEIYEVWMSKTGQESNHVTLPPITTIYTNVTNLAYWKAYIKVTVPSGATATIKNGTETYTITSTTTKEIHTKGTWTFECKKDNMSAVTYKLDGASSTTKSKSITTDGSTTTVDFSASYGYLKVTTTSDFASNAQITLKNSAGSTVTTKTSASNTYTFTIATAGKYTATATAKDSKTYTTVSRQVNLGSTANVTLETVTTLNLTVYSASNDTITIKRSDGTLITTCTTDSTGKATNVNITIKPSGETITFESSVAEALSGSGKYSKTISLTKDSTNAYVMPNNTIFWYGCLVNGTIIAKQNQLTSTDPRAGCVTGIIGKTSISDLSKVKAKYSAIGTAGYSSANAKIYLSPTANIAYLNDMKTATVGYPFVGTQEGGDTFSNISGEVNASAHQFVGNFTAKGYGTYGIKIDYIYTE